MSNHPINQIFEKAITEAFDHRTETMDYTGQDTPLLIRSMEAFMASLTEEQRTLYDEYEQYSISVEGEIRERCYRLGTIDGLNLWRGA